MQEECNGRVLKAMPVTGVQLSHQLFPILKIQSTGAKVKKRLLRSDNYSLHLLEIISYSTLRHTFCIFFKNTTESPFPFCRPWLYIRTLRVTSKRAVHNWYKTFAFPHLQMWLSVFTHSCRKKNATSINIAGNCLRICQMSSSLKAHGSKLEIGNFDFNLWLL